jgi:hypothetical protein
MNNGQQRRLSRNPIQTDGSGAGSTRRDFLTSAAGLAVAPLVGGITRAFEPGKGPIFGTPPAEGVKTIRKLAAVTTTYYQYSHADDIITRFFEGYTLVGKHHQPPCQVLGMYADQLGVGKPDVGRDLAKKHGCTIYPTIAKALTLGGERLAVDGVLHIVEQGEYPFNEKGQHLYPRKQFFDQIVEVFRRSGRSVPVYVDKFFSYDRSAAHEMYRTHRELCFPMMAGSSVPVAWRRPPLELPIGVRLDSALSLAHGSIEAYGFHGLEALQCMIERRCGGETGVCAVQAFSGAAAWKAAADGIWSRELLDAALNVLPASKKQTGNVEDMDHDAVVFVVEYRDGFRAATYMSRRFTGEFGFAARICGRAEPVATWMELIKPERDHFSFLSANIERMFVSGRATYPVERTYLITGVLAYLMDSLFESGRRIETPDLAICYTPATDIYHG